MNIHELNKREWRSENIQFIESNPNHKYYGRDSLMDALNDYATMYDKPVGFDKYVRFIQCKEGKIINCYTLQEAKRVLKLIEI